MLNTHEDVLNKIAELEERLLDITIEESDILYQLNALNNTLISMGAPKDNGEEA